MARKSNYKAAYNAQAEKLSRLGATDEEMADFFGINVATLNRWKKKHEKFRASIKKGKLEADANVSERLYTRAIGYSYKEVTYEKVQFFELGMAVGEEGDLTEDEKQAFKKKVVEKEMPPDVTAQIFWLKNRRGKLAPPGAPGSDGNRWADKQELSGPQGGPIPLVKLTADEARQIAKDLENDY